MKREAFLRELRKQARQLGLSFAVDSETGKGSHYGVTVGQKKTIIKSGEITPLYAKLIKKQLGL